MSKMHEAVAEQDASKSEQESWGDRLRRGRELQEFSTADVAAELRLDERIIIALESEDLGTLPGSSFTKGYLRNYGRMLGLNTDALVACYEGNCDGETPPQLTRIGTEEVISSSKGMPRVVTVGGIIVLLVFVVFWWWGKIKHSDSASMADSSAGFAAESSAVIPEPETGTTQLALPVPEPVAPAEKSSEAPQQQPEVASKPAVADQAEAAPVAESVGSEAAEPDSVTVTLTFNEESWVEISDARDKRLYFDLGKPGDQIELKGVPPLKVLLGNAPGVVFEYNGKRFDTTRYERKGVARFKFSS